MKKSISLLFILGISILVAFSQTETTTIGILNDITTMGSDTLLTNLKKEIRGVIGVGTNVEFQPVLYNGYNLKESKENYLKLSKSSDIIISFGVVNSIMLSELKTFPKPTIAIGSISMDFVDIPEGLTKSNVNNFTYLITPFSYKEDLEVFNELISYKKLGVVVDSLMLDYLPIKNYFDAYFTQNEGSYTFIHPRNLIENGDLKNCDAVYYITGLSNTPGQSEKLIEIVNSAKIPSISSFGVKDVEKGVLMSNQPEMNIDQIFRRIALNVESIVDGTNPSELPLLIDYTKITSINMETAKQIGYPIRYSLFGSVNLIEGTSMQSDTTVSYSLDRLLLESINRNLSLSAERKSIELVEQDLKLSKSQYLPNVSANAGAVYLDPELAETALGQNPELTTNGNVALEQVLYSEQATANISIQKSTLSAQRESYNTQELDLILQASSFYYSSLIAKTNVSIQNQNLQLTKRNLSIAQQNFDAGATGKSDVLRFRSQLAQNTQSLITSKNTLDQSFYSLNQILNKPINSLMDVESADIQDNVIIDNNYRYLIEAFDDPEIKNLIIEFLVIEAKKNSPEIKNLDFNIEANDRYYRLNKNGRYIPTVGLGGKYDQTFTRSGAGTEFPPGFNAPPLGTYNVGVNVTLPIFQQNQQNINRQTAIIQSDQLNIQLENTELTIEKNINDIVLDLINEIANIEISTVNEAFSKESLELSQSEYRNGAIPVIQLIDAQNNYLKAQQSKATANFNYLLVTMKLERAIGYFFATHTDQENLEFIQRANQYIQNNL